MGIFRQGLSESTVNRQNINAKPTKSGFLYRAHTKVTGTDIPTNKFALDVIPYYDPANPPPVKRSDIPLIRNETTPAIIGNELTYTLPIGLQQINLRNVGGTNVELYIKTTSGGAIFTIPEDGSLTWDNLNLTAARDIYIASNIANAPIESWEWT